MLHSRENIVEVRICKNKKSFDTKEEAQEKLKEIKLKVKDSDKKEKYPIREYKCPVCLKWHLTSISLGKQKKRDIIRRKSIVTYWELKLGVKERFRKPKKKKRKNDQKNKPNDLKTIS
jgi:hypothetical protein